MPFHQAGALRYYTFESFDRIGISHAILTRQGGDSPAPWNSLNLGGTVGDDPQRVRRNHQIAFEFFGRQLNSMFDVWQVHGRQAICADAPRPTGGAHIQADIILTDKPEVTLFMRFADCVPILLFDPVQRIGAIAHAGWRGTMLKAGAAAVEKMQQAYGSQPRDILAGIGPSIALHHYQVGAEVVNQAHQVFGAQAERLLHPTNGHYHFDLWEANRLTLEQTGVEQIEVCGLCTACHLEDWYSHRQEHGKTGRFGVLLSTREPT